jgi:hypothetical protein
METYEIYPANTVVEYVLYTEIDGTEVTREGNIVTYDENVGMYHVGQKLGNGWSNFGFLWVHPRNVRKVVSNAS